MPVVNTKKRVGVLRGGKGEKYASSIERGAELLLHILENLSERWTPVDILVDKDNLWHMSGIPILPANLVHKVDVVWNCSLSEFSQILNSFSIPNIAIPTFAETVSGKREMLGELMKKIGVNMPKSIVLPLYQRDIDGEKEAYATKKARAVFEKFSPPWVVRSYVENAGMAVRVAKTVPELAGAILEGVNMKTSMLVEELITGKATAVHSLPGFRNEDIYVFPSPDFSRTENEKLQEFSKTLHLALGVNNYLKSAVVLHPRRGIYLMDVNFSPSLKPQSHFDQSLARVGAKMNHITEHILESALK